MMQILSLLILLVTVVFCNPIQLSFNRITDDNGIDNYLKKIIEKKIGQIKLEQPYPNHWWFPKSTGKCQDNKCKNAIFTWTVKDIDNCRLVPTHSESVGDILVCSENQECTFTKKISLTKTISAMIGFKASFKWSAGALFTTAETTAEISGSVTTTRQTMKGEDYTFKIKENTACAPMRMQIELQCDAYTQGKFGYGPNWEVPEERYMTVWESYEKHHTTLSTTLSDSDGNEMGAIACIPISAGPIHEPKSTNLVYNITDPYDVFLLAFN